MNTLVIATRGSRLALWQAEHVRERLVAAHPGLDVDLKVIKTKGDIILDVPLAKMGGKGLFIKEIEEALLAGAAHVAVHSMKDVPMQLPAGLVLAAVPERENPADLFLSAHYPGVDALPVGGIVGTSSLRRQAQILALRPDLRVVSLRGNVDTRLQKLLNGAFDAIIMAAAGMKRLGLSAPHAVELPMTDFLPAVGQGALGLECRTDDRQTLSLIACLEHLPTRVCVEAERGFLAGLEGGCQTPIAGHAVYEEAGTFCLEGMVAATDGSELIRRSISGSAGDARQTGLELAAIVRDAGASRLLAAF